MQGGHVVDLNMPLRVLCGTFTSHWPEQHYLCDGQHYKAISRTQDEHFNGMPGLRSFPLAPLK